jgi:dTDP-L-rhamnose 4-epimerase
VGSGQCTSVETVAVILKRCYDSKSSISITGNFRLGDIRHNYADISNIQNMLGVFPRYTFEQEIKLFTEWVEREKIEKDDSYQQSLLEMKAKGLFK